MTLPPLASGRPPYEWEQHAQAAENRLASLESGGGGGGGTPTVLTATGAADGTGLLVNVQIVDGTPVFTYLPDATNGEADAGTFYFTFGDPATSTHAELYVDPLTVELGLRHSAGHYMDFSVANNNVFMNILGPAGTSAGAALASFGVVGGTGECYLLANGDVFVSGDGTNGVVLQAPDSSRWRITVDNSGVLHTAVVIG